MTKKLISLLMSILLCLTLCVGKVNGATGIKQLKMGKKYTIALNGKKVTFKMKGVKGTLNGYTSDSYRIKVYINGKCKKTFGETTDHYANAELITLKNKKSYIVFHISGDWSYGEDFLMYYSGGKLKLMSSMTKLNNNKYCFDETIEPIKVSGNTVTITYGYQFTSYGITDMTYKFKYSSGTLKRTSKYTTKFNIYVGYPEASRTWTTCRKIQAYTKANSKTKKFVIGANKKFTAKKIWLDKKNVYLKVTYGSKTGWIKLTQKYSYIDEYGADAIKNASHAG